MAGLYSLNAVRASSKVFTQDIKAIKERSKSKTREKKSQTKNRNKLIHQDCM